MTRKSMTLLAALLIAATSTSANDVPQSTSQAYLEVVVLRPASGGDFEAARRVAVRQMEEEPGFIWWQRLEAEDGSKADVLAWVGAEAALAAADRVETAPEFAPYMAAIETVQYSGHFWAAADAKKLEFELSTAPFVELAIYSVPNPEPFLDGQKSLYARFEQRAEPLGGVPLAGDVERREFGDLLTWSNRQSWESTGAELSADPTLAPFFSQIGEMYVFELYRPVAD